MLPNLSYMMNVGQVRFIQSRYEEAEYRNPDTLAGNFLSSRQLLKSFVRGKFLMQRLRNNPFYHYVLARTKYYDDAFLSAIYSGARCIVNIGCGSDSRSYRFAHILEQNGVTVLECDQPQAIHSKQEVVKKLWPVGNVRHIPLDLNRPDTEFWRLMDSFSSHPTFVMLEGVSPYIDAVAFASFLESAKVHLNPSSLLAYDYKFRDVDIVFGKSVAVSNPFRLSRDKQATLDFHSALGLHVSKIESSSDLVRRLLPRSCALFEEDCLLKLTFIGSS